MFLQKRKPEDAFSRYVDPTGAVPNSELKMGEWYLRHKLLLERIRLIAVGTVAVTSMSYSIFAWGKYFVIDYGEDVRMMREQTEFPNYEALQSIYQADPLSIGNTTVTEIAPGRYDFITPIKNPNDRFMVALSYKYVFDGGETEITEDILLPQDDRPVVLFGKTFAGYPANARLSIENVRWQRIDPHRVPDVSAHIEPRLQFTAENVTFRRGRTGEAHSIGFDLTNASAYSYWQPVFYVDLLNEEQTVGLIYVMLEKFRAGETRRVDIQSVLPDLTVTDVRIHPVLNVFNPDVYMDPGA
ncbi:MAG TPA: hypothetical protein VEA18_01880 [Candidatus Kapabacteria bacterium]|nr:hypothetical protein [Candidatus Kapabacteria bacterium]